ncbi:MAG: hypothetical protein Q9191_005176 [Dirinaria sp. TL-2023a]
MYSIEPGLSQLRYTNEDANLKLESACSLKLSSRQKFNLASTNPIGLLDFLDTAEAWVARGHGIRLCIHLALDQVRISSQKGRALAEHLALSLQDPEWWKKLGTEAALNLPSSISVVDSLIPDLMLTLACNERLTGGTNDSNGIYGLASQGVKPPLGLRQIYLETIDLTLTISALRRDDARERATEPEQSFSSDIDLSMLIDKNGDDFSLFEDGQGSHSAGFSQQIYARQHSLSNDQHTASIGLERSWHESAMNPNHSQNSFSSFSSYPHKPIPLILAKNDYDNSTTSLPRDVSVEHCFGLVDAALRRTLGGNDKCLARGTRALNSPKVLTPAAIAPALFNPSYQQAISQRSSLIPSITNRLLAIHGRTKCQTLKAEIEQAVQPSLEEGLILTQDCPDDEKHNGVLPTLSTKMELRLWKLMQSRLRNCRSVYKLKPVYGRNTGYATPTIQASMPDEPPPATYESAIFPITEDEDYWMLDGSDSMSLDDMLESSDVSEQGESMLDEILLEDEQRIPLEGDSVCSDDMLPDEECEDEDLFNANTLASQTDLLDSHLLFEEITGIDNGQIFDNLGA